MNGFVFLSLDCGGFAGSEFVNPISVFSLVLLKIKLIFPCSLSEKQLSVGCYLHNLEAFHNLSYTSLTSHLAFSRTHKSGESPRFSNIFIVLVPA